ncbi:MAG: BsuBI/PstI family type II restriction endonuclease [Candidatus Melainabacteria bacterium]|nr:BsuBI/PstI family type II restriction endonuclease [Candidatus Melainabacteria bacterium]
MAQAALAERIDFFRLDANRKLNPETRSVLGQFMTPAPIASFMASLFENISGLDIALLDPGAGVGSLTAAFVEECLNREQRPSSLSLTAYEIEPVLLDYLHSTLNHSRSLAEDAGIAFTETVKAADFIEDGAGLLTHNLLKGPASDALYTHVIMNPPYKKIHSDSAHRLALSRIGIDTSNLYTAFMALAIRLLKPGGELVAIVPRSFCNGPYFRPFREFLLSEMSLKRLHVFESRNQAFKEDDVLQENIILHAVKGVSRDSVTISSSRDGRFRLDADTGQMEACDMTLRHVPYASIVKPGDAERFIHIAATDFEQQILDRIGVFETSLDALGMSVSTGPVVDFRLKADLRKVPEADTAPLLYPVHFQDGALCWPKPGKKPNALHLSDESRKWLWPNRGHYVVTKRFSTKEEARRIVAAVYDSSLPGEWVGFENHLNVFHAGQTGLSRDMAYGLALYLNSTLLDRYFRQFNGHTQVNATDLRSFRYPDKSALERMGQQVSGQVLPEQAVIDTIVNKEIERMDTEGTRDPVTVQQKIDEALAVVKALGMPKAQHNDRSALTLLALLDLKPGGSWQSIERPLMGITPIMEFCLEHYGKNYAPNTRETFRRQTMHQFVDAAIALYNPDEPGRAVNSPKACYQISPEAFEVIVTYGTEQWSAVLSAYLAKQKTLAERYARERAMQMIPVEVADGQEISLTPGAHSQLIRDIIVEFAPRYAPGAEVIYVGDTGDKIGYFQRDRLADMGITVDRHGKMPDVVLHYPAKDWLLLVESVTSHGPVDAKRHEELAKLFCESRPGLVYVTAFPDRSTMARYLADISWETEVWVAEAPTHMIHFNGERFLGPYEKEDNG